MGAPESGKTTFSVKLAEALYQQRKNELTADQIYYVLTYEGNLTFWTDVIPVYAVKLNLDSEDPQEVATFDQKKADKLREIFWDMYELSLRSETRVIYVTHQEIDADGNIMEEISLVYLIVTTSSKGTDQMAREYRFRGKQIEMLEALLNEENAELWAGILGE